MTTALIVIGVVVFLLVDFVILRKVLMGHKKADTHGELPVPGETTLELPAGKTTLTYQEAQHTSGGGEHEIAFYAPGDLVVTVTPAGGGDPLEIKGPGFAGTGSSKSTGIGFSRLLVGSVEVPAAGSYTVKAESAETGGLKSPKILVGS
jgi:hypothetical protein